MQVGGAALPVEQRALAEAAAAHIAATAAAAQRRLSSGHETSARARGVCRLAAAALRALATAVAVPGSHRPVLLPEAVALFTEVGMLILINSYDASLFSKALTSAAV